MSKIVCANPVQPSGVELFLFSGAKCDSGGSVPTQGVIYRARRYRVDGRGVASMRAPTGVYH